MSDALVEIIGLSKRFKDVDALKDVTLRVGKGQIFGLLGQNGAGKTTLVKILLGLVRPGQGRALLFGEPWRKTDLRRRIGYLPEGHEFPGYHTAAGVLDFYGALYGLSGSDRRRRIDEALRSVELTDVAHRKIRTFSKGMKQRLGIAHAIFHDPELLFLDEPTDGIDPLGRRAIRDLMLRLKQQGRTIFLNSHLLGEVEQVCDRVAILDRGTLRREGTVAELTGESGRLSIALGADPGPHVEELKRAFPAARVEAWTLLFPVSTPPEVDRVVDWLRGRGLPIRTLTSLRTLEDAFVQVVQGP